MSARREPSVALVTGGSRGIGEHVCHRIARAGVTVWVAARTLSGCERVVGALEGAGGRARALELDVGDPRSIEAALATLRAAGDEGTVDWLVNNAGMAESAPYRSADATERVRRHMQVNFEGPRLLMEALVPGMVARGHGRVVNVASSAGLRGYAYVSAYCASKFALMGYSLSVAEEVDGSGVTVNLVAPHYVDSPMLEASVERLVAKTNMDRDTARQFFRRANPGGELVTMDEVAAAVVVLLQAEDNATVLELDGSTDHRLWRPNQELETEESE
jgi:NAD(P)-dependent dehydrogenase (short-subunit alcohol dehydrogenase family)